MGAGTIIAKEYSSLATGIPNLDRFGIRGNVLIASAIHGVPPRVLMGIIWRESGGDPNNYLGDVSAPGGPSVGPGQVYRQTAKDLGLWTPPPGSSDSDERAAYADMADQESTGISWSAQVLSEKISDAGGDITDGIRRYNGAGTAAQTYRDAVASFLHSTYGGVA